MIQNTQTAKVLTALVALALVMTGCTKKRDATLPDEAQETIFSISEIDSMTNQYQIRTDDSMSVLPLGQAAKATAEKGMVAVAEVNVPARLKYMFKGLELTAQPGRAYPVVIAVDRQFVTAYKVVTNLSELSLLETQLAQVKEEVILQKKLQKEKSNKNVKSLMGSLQKIRSEKQSLLSRPSVEVLVPIFKFPIKAYGKLNRVKNELREETSVLRLKSTDWSEATHVQISDSASDRILVDLEPSSRGNLDRTFVMNKINNKLMTAGTLKEQFQIPLNLEKNTRILTLLDVDVLHVFEIGQVGKTVLTDSQLEQLRVGSNRSNVRSCSDEIIKNIPVEAQKDCVMILRYDVPVTYVRAELPIVDHDGNQKATVEFKPVRAAEATGLVQIDQNVEPKKIEANNLLDPRTTLRVSDIKGKEFFFRRTMEDVPETSVFTAGESGALAIVKLHLEENRISVRKTDKIINQKSGSNDLEFEELMSIPVKYFKYENKDASGAKYSIARMAPATRVDAEFIELDWTKNTLTSDYSPYASVYDQCIRSIADTQVSDVDMKMDRGILNFSFNYSAGLAAGCIASVNTANDYNGTPNYSTTARFKERISFKINDGKTDKNFVAEIPFNAQNAMNYGVWTLAQVNADQFGLTGREGQERNMVVVQDFRDGKVLTYTVTGLEPSANISPQLRELYKKTVRDVVNSWDFAYRQVFKGSKFERSGRYVEVQFSGFDGVTAKLGDLDKHILHFDNKINPSSGGLGVSQVGYNPRSGIVIADSLIIYAGNLQSYVATHQRNQKNVELWKSQLESVKEKAKVEMAAELKAGAPATGDNAQAGSAVELTKRLVNMFKAQNSMDALGRITPNAINTSALKTKLEIRKSLGSAGAFTYAAPKAEYAWVDRAMRALKKNHSMDVLELEGIVAKEMLADKGAKLNQKDKSNLELVVRRGEIRAKINAHYKGQPGCKMVSMDSMLAKFANESFEDGYRQMLYFTLAHEMGHSQGLTHNFSGSFDKKNFGNRDGSVSERNYSSVMDYFSPGTFRFDGIGSYDIHALRASHLGMLETRDGQFVHVSQLKLRMGNSWTRFNERSFEGVLKPYEYCTDIHVRLRPTCERFDTGTTAVEIVENLIEEYHNGYIANYHAWDRNSFFLGQAASAIGRSMYTMHSMRQFMDEFFYKAIAESSSSEEVADYAQAATKVYLFLNQVIRTPDARSTFFGNDRLVIAPYQYKEVNKDGQETGKILKDIAVVEKRALQHISVSDHQIDTVGYENDKVIAMNLLTMQGFPLYKYSYAGLEFSFMDFERMVLGMSPDSSLYVDTIRSILLNKLEPSFTNENVMLAPLAGVQASVTNTMRFYAALYSVLNLEASTLKEQDNNANLFKVGTSIGTPPSDRVALTQLGVSRDSKRRVSYWALDNAAAASGIVRVAAEKDFFIRNEEFIAKELSDLAGLQLVDLLSGGAQKEKIKEAKIALSAKLTTLNRKGQILSSEAIKQNPKLNIEAIVDDLSEYNRALFQLAIGLLKQDPAASKQAQNFAKLSFELAEAIPLYSLNQKAALQSSMVVGKNISGQKNFEILAQLGQVVGNLVSGDQLENSYGIIMKNLDLLSRLSLMTNPELNRQ